MQTVGYSVKYSTEYVINTGITFFSSSGSRIKNFFYSFLVYLYFVIVGRQARHGINPIMSDGLFCPYNWMSPIDNIGVSSVFCFCYLI